MRIFSFLRSRWKTRKQRLLLKIENQHWDAFPVIAGLDEAGRGAWAGPVSAAAVIMPRGVIIPGVRDSKLIPEEKREELFHVICREAIAFGIGLITADIIDQINILQATKLAMLQAVKSLTVKPDLLLIDGKDMEIDIDIPQRSIITGDALSHSIAAASILAKVTRDRLMREFDGRFPDYGFAAHKGYGTAIHRKALTKKGVSVIHRKSYGPVRNVLRSGTGC